ncbi:hypothetical protein C5167_016432 [Papaver somniferum]|nr:hypothetical protein C5167_016432 [Papaver somniferum]
MYRNKLFQKELDTHVRFESGFSKHVVEVKVYTTATNLSNMELFMQEFMRRVEVTVSPRHHKHVSGFELSQYICHKCTRQVWLAPEVLNQGSQEVEIVFHNTSCKKSEQRRLSFIFEPVFVDDLQECYCGYEHRLYH